MEYNEISYLGALSTLTLYLVGIVREFGILPSISESFYRLNERKKGLGIVFTYVMPVVAVMVMVSCEYWSTTIAGVGLILVAAAPYFKDIWNKYVHYIGALVAVMGTQVYLIHLIYTHKGIDISVRYIAVIALTSILIKHTIKKNTLWWMEIFFFSLFFLIQGIYLFI